MTTLDWYTSESADRTHHDQEVDLDKVGNPGGASWAYVALGFSDTTWTWGVMDRWLEEDATELAHGEAPTDLEAKLAVQRWVEAQEGYAPSHDAEVAAVAEKEREAMFTAQANEEIKVQDVGSSVVVLADGAKVAEFLYMGRVSDKPTMLAAAEEHAVTLRRRMIALAMGTLKEQVINAQV